MSSAAPFVAWADRQALTPPGSPSQPQGKSTRTAPNPDTVEPDAAAFDMLDLNATPLEEEIPEQQVRDAQEIQPEANPPLWKDVVPRPYLKRYELIGSVADGFQEYGRGAWANVFRAIERLPGKIAAPLTPPLSPPNSPKQAGINRLLALKVPSRKDAHPIIRQEARILTYLHAFPSAPDYLVAFHGYDYTVNSLVFSAVPLSLDWHVKQAAHTAWSSLSKKTMFHPVVGEEEWWHLARYLIGGLAFLHGRNCVHGDIKPGNILLQPSGSSFIPLFCDFSSSRVMPIARARGEADEAEEVEEVEEVTAITLEYTSPELLESFRTPDTRSITSHASDVFALGVTLLVMAIGESPYASARLEVQKLAMTREGRPLDFARADEGAARVMKGKMVDRTIAMSLEQKADRRVAAEDWVKWTVEEEERMRG